MAANISKSNHLTPLHFKELNTSACQFSNNRFQ